MKVDLLHYKKSIYIFARLGAILKVLEGLKSEGISGRFPARLIRPFNGFVKGSFSQFALFDIVNILEETNNAKPILTI
jgi:hypothetical protein